MGRIALVVVAALLAASCGSDSYDGYDVADSVLAAVAQPREETEVVTGECERSTFTDEYGFEEEVVVCPDDSAAVNGGGAGGGVFDPDGPLDADQVLEEHSDLPTWVLARLVAAVPDAELRGSLEDMSATIDAMDVACGLDFDAWTEQLRLLGDQAESVRDRVEDGLGSDGYVGSVPSRATGRALFERAVLETGCQGPGVADAQPLDEMTERGVLDETARTGQAVADLDRVMGGQLMDRLFHFYSTRPNYEWLRTQEGPVDVIVFGTSQAGAAVQVDQLSDQLDAQAGNAFLPGSLVEVQQHWFPEALRYVDPHTVIWFIGGIDLLIDCEPGNHETEFIERVENRNRAFQAGGWFRTIDPITVVLGPPGAADTNRGDARKAVAPDPDALAAHAVDYADRFATAEFCPSRGEVIADAVAELASGGRDVVIVGMPLNPAAADDLPDPVGQGSRAVNQLETEYLAGIEGVHVIDLTSAMQDAAWWVDFTHLTSDGSDQFTALVADAVEAATS